MFREQLPRIFKFYRKNFIKFSLNFYNFFKFKKLIITELCHTDSSFLFKYFF